MFFSIGHKVTDGAMHLVLMIYVPYPHPIPKTSEDLFLFCLFYKKLWSQKVLLWVSIFVGVTNETKKYFVLSLKVFYDQNFNCTQIPLKRRPFQVFFNK